MCVCVCVCVYVCVSVCVCVCALVPTDIWGHLWVFNPRVGTSEKWGRPHMKEPVHHLSNVFFSMYFIYETIEEICVCGSQIVG